MIYFVLGLSISHTGRIWVSVSPRPSLGKMQRRLRNGKERLSQWGRDEPVNLKSRPQI